MPRSVSVSSSAQSSTTTAMLAILALNVFGRRRSAFSTSPSNCRRVMSGARPLESSHALDVDDVFDFADLGDDVLELAEIGDLDDEVVDAAPVVSHGDLGLRDVAVAGRDGARDLRQEPRSVLADVNGDADRPLAGLLHVPLDVDQPLAVQDALGDGQAIARVHREPAAARDEADDRITGQRIAAPREPHQQVVDTADPDTVGGLGTRRGRARLLRRLQQRVRGELVQDLVGRALAVADRRQQVVGAAREPGVGGDLLELVAAEQGRRIQVVLPRLALEHLAAQLDRAGALLDLEPLVDLRPGARGLDDLQPVAARVLVRGGDDLDDVALPQGVAERDELAVHLRAHAVLADLRSEEHTSELQSLTNLVCRLLLEKKKKKTKTQ